MKQSIKQARKLAIPQSIIRNILKVIDIAKWLFIT